jgi:glycosyltransferase involved in cell wall biosynthesis
VDRASFEVAVNPYLEGEIHSNGHRVVDLLYLHGSTLQSLLATGKVDFLDALNPNGLFNSVHMVNIDTSATSWVERTRGAFRFTTLPLGRHGRGRFGKLRSLLDGVNWLSSQGRPDLVLADDANLLGWVARAVAHRTKCRYAICVYYDNDLHYRLSGRPALAFLKSRHLEVALERVIFKGAVGVYAGNVGYRNYGIRHGADPEKTYLGVASVDEIFYGEPGLPNPDSREIFFVGRLHPLKYVDDVVRALKLLPPDVRLDVAGDGESRKDLEALANSLGVAQRVRFLGMISRNEVLSRMWGAQVLVVTQGFNAAVESLLSQRPVVAYDHECNGEVIRHEDTGLLVAFRDVKGLAAAMKRLRADTDLARRLTQRGREEMIRDFSIAASIAHRREFFVRCLAHGTRKTLVDH